MIGEPDTRVSSRGQNDLVFFAGFIRFLQEKTGFYTPDRGIHSQ
jgi:hypothetical protein